MKHRNFFFFFNQPLLPEMAPGLILRYEHESHLPGCWHEVVKKSTSFTTSPIIRSCSRLHTSQPFNLNQKSLIWKEKQRPTTTITEVRCGPYLPSGLASLDPLCSHRPPWLRLQSNPAFSFSLSVAAGLLRWESVGFYYVCYLLSPSSKVSLGCRTHSEHASQITVVPHSQKASTGG